MADFSFSEASQKFTKKKRSYSSKSATKTVKQDKVKSLDEIVSELANDPNFKTDESRANFLTRLGSGLGALSAAPQLADVTSGKKSVGSAVMDYFPQVVDRLAKTFNPKTSQAELDKYNDAASRLVTNLGGESLPKPAKFIADLATDIAVDPSTYIPFANLLGVGGKVTKVATPVIRSAKGVKTLTKEGAGLLDNIVVAAEKSLGENPDSVIKFLDENLPGLSQKIKTSYSKSPVDITGKVLRPAEISELTTEGVRKMASQDIAETIMNEIIDNNGVSKTLNALPTKYADEIAKTIGDTSVLFDGGRPIKPIVDLNKIGEPVKPIVHKAYSTLPKSLQSMLSAAKTGITAAFDNFPVFRDMPIVRESFQKMLNANRGAKDFGESVLNYFNRQFNTLTKVKGYTPEDIISTVEYIGRPGWRKKILKNTPRVKEILNDTEVSPLINTITQLFNESDTLGLLGVEELGGYFARMVDKTDASTMDALRKAGLIKSPKRMMGGFAKERILDMPFTEAQKILGAAGGKYKTDLAYILANYATRMSQAKNTLSFFASLMDTPLVKLAKDAPPEFVKISEKTLPFLKGYKVSPEVSGVLEKIVNVTQGKYSPAGVLQIFDKVSNLFKEIVTVFFPAFHTRNLMSNMFNIMVSGESPAKIPKLYKKALEIQKYSKMLDEGKDVSGFGRKILATVGKRQYTVQELFELVRSNGIRGGQISEAIAPGNAVQEVLKGTLGQLRTGARNLGKGVEDSSRIALFLSGLERGATPYNAAGMVKKFLFNYDELTDFEKNVMRRLLPFYSYLRFNTELQLTLLLKNPKMYSKLLKAGNALAGSDDDENNVLPDWTKQTLGLDLTGIIPSKSGEIVFSPGLGLPPEQLNNVFGRTGKETGENIIGMLNPMLKIPLEQTFDYNVFKGKKISEDTDGTTYKNAPPWMKKLIGYKEKQVKVKNRDGKEVLITKYTVDPQKKYYINSVFGRIASTSMRGLDFGAAVNDGTANWSDLLPLLTGVKTYTFNIEEERAKREAEKKKRILDKLFEEGYGKKYTGTSIDTETRKQIIDKYLE